VRRNERVNLRSLAAPSTRLWLSYVLGDWLVIGLSIAAIGQLWRYGAWWSYALLLPALVALGSGQHALSLMAHDGAHRMASTHRGLNDWLTQLCAFWPLGIDLGAYRRFHFTHHRTVGTPEDPELKHRLHRWPVLRQWWLPVDGWQPLLVLGDLCGGAVPHSLYAVFVLIAGYNDWQGFWWPKLYQIMLIAAFWYGGYAWVPGVWFLGLITTFWLVFRLRIWTEHVVEMGAGEPTQRIAGNWWQRWLFLPHHTDCHWEHHYTWDRLRLQVPSWNLPQARAMLEGPPVLTLGQLLDQLRHADRSYGTLQK
jgi:fatty acid desaturase